MHCLDAGEPYMGTENGLYLGDGEIFDVFECHQKGYQYSVPRRAAQVGISIVLFFKYNNYLGSTT